MNWLDSLLKAIAAGLGLAQQSTNPEVIRLTTIIEIDKKLEVERTKRDANMAIQRTPENELELGTALGIITNRIVELRKTRAPLER